MALRRGNRGRVDPPDPLVPPEDATETQPSGPPAHPDLVVSDVRPEYGDDVQATTAQLTGGRLDAAVRVRFRLHGEGPLDHSGTPFVPLAAILGAFWGADVVIDAGVDAAAVVGARRAVAVQSAFWGWRTPALHAPDAVDAGPAAQPDADDDGRGVGLFFTRGVDSTAALLTDGGAVTHLLGIDWVEPPYGTEGTAAVWAGTAAAAAERGLPLLRLSTDLRAFSEPEPGWRHTHIVALAGCALMLAPQLREAWVGATEQPVLPKPWPSHPDSDALWSSSQVALVHRFPGVGARIDRVAMVLGDDWAMRRLKLCYARDGDGNCGQCPKCLTTMTMFEVLGAGGRIAEVFDAPLSAAAVRATLAEPQLGGLAARRDLVARLPEGDLRDAWVEVVEATVAARLAAGLPT